MFIPQSKLSNASKRFHRELIFYISAVLKLAGSIENVFVEYATLKTSLHCLVIQFIWVKITDYVLHPAIIDLD